MLLLQLQAVCLFGLQYEFMLKKEEIETRSDSYASDILRPRMTVPVRFSIFAWSLIINFELYGYNVLNI